MTFRVIRMPKRPFDGPCMDCPEPEVCTEERRCGFEAYMAAIGDDPALVAGRVVSFFSRKKKA